MRSIDRRAALVVLVLLLIFGGAASAQDPAPEPEQKLNCRGCLTDLPGPCYVIENSSEFDGAYCEPCAVRTFRCRECAAEAFLGIRRTPLGRIVGRVPLTDDGYCQSCASNRERERAATETTGSETAPVVSSAPTAVQPPAPATRRVPTFAIAGVGLLVAFALVLVFLRTRPEGPARAAPARANVFVVPTAKPGPPGAMKGALNRFDPTLGDETAKKLRTELQRGEWRHVDAHLGKLLDERKWPDRAFYAEALAEWPGRPPFLDAWVLAAPKSPHALLVRGRHAINWAWEARGTGKGKDLSPDQARLFASRLEQAEKDFRAAADLAPADPTPWAFLCHTARGLSAPIDEKKKRLAEANAREPHGRLAHENALRSLLAKWGGSHDEAFALAREASASAPEGHPVQVVVPIAHVERWLYARAFENDPAKARGYFADPAVQAEITTAYERSVGSKSYQPSRASAVERNWFAFAFYLMGKTDLAARECQRIGAAVTEWPWTYVGDPREHFRKALDKHAYQAP